MQRSAVQEKKIMEKNGIRNKKNMTNIKCEKCCTRKHEQINKKTMETETQINK